MKRIWTLVAMTMLAWLPAAAMADTPAETDQAKFVRLTQHLERYPLDPDATPMRAWLLDWAVKTPDVQVLMCDFLDPAADLGSHYGGLLLMQMLYGNAAWQIVHPGAHTDVVAPQIAGVRSALKAYAEISIERPEAQNAEFDALVLAEQRGTLQATLAPRILQQCSKDDAAKTIEGSP
jgi:hypothetical protein